jgi:hypothetical protein
MPKFDVLRVLPVAKSTTVDQRPLNPLARSDPDSMMKPA